MEKNELDVFDVHYYMSYITDLWVFVNCWVANPKIE
jgi:hypothetical protein